MSIGPGDVVRGKYRVNTSIGRGGMGEVFAATRLADHAEVAMKVVSRAAADETLMGRLEREAIAARRIRSPFVPELYDVDRTDDGEVFLVMRRLSGIPLWIDMRQRGVLPFSDVRWIVDDALCGLVDAHAAGVVHRDLKPGNLFIEQPDAPTIPSTQSAPSVPLDARERCMILDFGVCKLDAHDQERLTNTGETVGTVSYMAPEQIRGASTVDARADLYSLAIVAFELLAGRLPFDGDGQMALLAAKLEAKPKRIARHAKVPIPPELDALLARALARDPAARFASAAEMLIAWRALGEPELMPRPVAPSIPATSELAQDGPAGGNEPSRPPPISVQIVLGLAAATATLAIGALLWLVLGGSTRTPAHALAPQPSASATEAPPTSGDPGVDAADVAIDASTVALPVIEFATSAQTTRPAPPVAAPHVSGTRPPPSNVTSPHITSEPRY